jgi:hypothetical protein
MLIPKPNFQGFDYCIMLTKNFKLYKSYIMQQAADFFVHMTRFLGFNLKLSL